MRLKNILYVLLCWLPVYTQAQDMQVTSSTIGDMAPPLRLCEWIKGEPITQFEKGKVYVVEFWATWCKPCITALNHISFLAAEHKNDVSVLGVNVYETKSTSITKLRNFVDRMPLWTDYHLAREDSNFMETGWLAASGEKDKGIPRTFVINRDGKVAWIGYPNQLTDVLLKILNNTWDINYALAKRKELQRLEQLDKDSYYELLEYRGDPRIPGNVGKPAQALAVISEKLLKEPKLKFAPNIAHATFDALLKTDFQKAYKFGKAAIEDSIYGDDNCQSISGNILTTSDKLNFDDGCVNKLKLPAQIYELGATAYETEMQRFPYPELLDLSKFYYRIAEMYWCANSKKLAIQTMQKAIDKLKTSTNFSKARVAVYELRLQHYKKM